LRLASCIVVEDKDKRTLLTLRSSKLRVFPNSWVLPGGHIDAGESLEEGVIRELREETGIDLEQNTSGVILYRGKTVKLSPFFVFESSIPGY